MPAKLKPGRPKRTAAEKQTETITVRFTGEMSRLRLRRSEANETLAGLVRRLAIEALERN